MSVRGAGGQAATITSPSAFSYPPPRTGSARSGDCAHPAAKKIAANNHANICFIGFLLYSLFESFSKSVSSIPLPGVWVPGDMSVTAKGVARA